ncbi:MAG: hypothetical protein V4539_13855 [Bacteroidota bacterium]
MLHQICLLYPGNKMTAIIAINDIHHMPQAENIDMVDPEPHHINGR